MPKRGKAYFLVACGTSIATSTMVAEILREDLVRQKKYNIEFLHCKTSELLPKVDLLEPDVIISTAPVKPEHIENWRKRGILYFKGTPFLTGIGVEPLMKKLLSVIDTWDIKKIKAILGWDESPVVTGKPRLNPESFKGGLDGS